MASWTEEQLVALEAAMAQGVLKVRWGDKMQEFRSLTEMQQLRSQMRRALGQGPKVPLRRYPSQSKGV